jgi:HAD superfamily hydrolase (TIGR01549 family)
MLRAVCFDLDGTITRPRLDFNKIREEIGQLTGEGTLLDQIARLPESERARALGVLHRHEEEAVAAAELNEGVAELLEFIASRGLRAGLITRNSDQSTREVLERFGLRFHRVITRDSGLPLKPDPAPVLALCREWGLCPAEVLVVGDYRYDTEAGKAAGAFTCLVTNGRATADDGGADYVVKAPGEVIRVLREAEKRSCAPRAQSGSGKRDGR